LITKLIKLYQNLRTSKSKTWVT